MGNPVKDIVKALFKGAKAILGFVLLLILLLIIWAVAGFPGVSGILDWLAGIAEQIGAIFGSFAGGFLDASGVNETQQVTA